MKISSRERLLLIGMVLFVVTWLCLDYVIEPQIEQLDEKRIEKRLNNLELQEYKMMLSSEPLLDASIEESYKAIEETAVNYFNTTPQDEMILLFNDFLAMPFVEDSVIKFSGMNNTTIEGVPFAKETITIEFSGQYASTVNMFKTIWNFPKKIQISELSLSGAGYDELKGTAVFDTYHFLVESEIVDGLYQWYVDRLLLKDNPFKLYEESQDIVRYLYLKDDEIFNYSMYFEFVDIEDHWLEKQITEYLEYGYLYLNPLLEFDPSDPITRGEFIVLVDSVYNWPIEVSNADLTDFRDYEDLGSLESSFAKAIHRGYLGGYIEGFDDNTLRPRDPITYLEVEYLMNRVKDTENFVWEDVISKLSIMSGETKDEWYTDDGLLTKAEAIFLLYYFK